MRQLASLALLSSFCTSIATPCLAGAPVTYKIDGSFYEGCFDPCHCIVTYQSTLLGGFRLQPEVIEPNYIKFAVINAELNATDLQMTLSGSGTYEQFIEFAVTSQMKLDLLISGQDKPKHFDSQVVFSKAHFPTIALPVSINNMECYDTVLTFVAEPVFGDITGDALVNVDDLLEVINHWGECPTGDDCNSDIQPEFTGDAVVDVDDLLMVIGNWGS